MCPAKAISSATMYTHFMLQSVMGSADSQLLSGLDIPFIFQLQACHGSCLRSHWGSQPLTTLRWLTTLHAVGNHPIALA